LLRNKISIFAASADNEEVSLQIDQDFCTRPISLKVPLFEIDPLESLALLKMAQNQQINHAYKTQDSLEQEPTIFLPFYGEVFKSINFDYYIPLDSLIQYFTDLPSWVKVTRKDGQYHFQLIGKQAELKLFDPLVMVDWVPVDDANAILSIKPWNVKKIDILNEPYIHGDILYGGIINILSKNNDFGGLRFPQSAMFLNIAFYDQNILEDPWNNPFGEASQNTLLWKTFYGKETAPNNIINLKAPQAKGNYNLLFQYLDNQQNKKFFFKEIRVN